MRASRCGARAPPPSGRARPSASLDGDVSGRCPGAARAEQRRGRRATTHAIVIPTEPANESPSSSVSIDAAEKRRRAGSPRPRPGDQAEEHPAQGLDDEGSRRARRRAPRPASGRRPREPTPRTPARIDGDERCAAERRRRGPTLERDVERRQPDHAAAATCRARRAPAPCPTRARDELRDDETRQRRGVGEQRPRDRAVPELVGDEEDPEEQREDPRREGHVEDEPELVARLEPSRLRRSADAACGEERGEADRDEQEAPGPRAVVLSFSSSAAKRRVIRPARPARR